MVQWIASTNVKEATNKALSEDQKVYYKTRDVAWDKNKTYYKDTSVASYVHPNAYTLTRNKVVRFKNRDSGLTFENIPLNDWENGENIEDEI